MSLSAAQVDRTGPWARSRAGNASGSQAQSAACPRLLPKWSRPFAYFALGISSGEFSQIVPVRRRKRDRAQEREDIDVSFGDKANEIDEFEHMHHRYGWWSPALLTLAGDESEDVTCGNRSRRLEEIREAMGCGGGRPKPGAL